MFVSAFKRKGNQEEFWALRDVSFEIDSGESVAIVGTNGAGKSTTLKLISRILNPTHGTVDVRGRVAALLELGSGFHPELTGRENLYMNGSLLGFNRAAMNTKFDDIVEFAGIKDRMDTPIKHYSSGMVMRLGFSVAIFTDPQVLITDEVLAVGDTLFQQKCMEKIWEFRREGRTILYVSHSLETARQLCSRAIWLQKGKLISDGPSYEVIGRYMRDTYLSAGGDEAAPMPGDSRWGSQEASITSVTFIDSNGQRRDTYETGESVTVRVEFVANERIEHPQFGIGIHRIDDVHVAAPNNMQSGVTVPYILGPGAFEYRIDSLPLLQGDYEFTAAIYDEHAIHPYDHHDRMYRMHILGGVGVDTWGLVHIPSTWSIESGKGEALLSPAVNA